MLERLRLPPTGRLPRWMVYAAIIAVIGSWLPLALVALARYTRSSQPRVSIFQDMADQPKIGAQDSASVFADGRGMRPPVAGSIARGELDEDDHYYRGYVRGELVVDPATDQKVNKWYDGYPKQVTVNGALLMRGRERFNIYCAVCHGEDGGGQGAVHRSAEKLKEATWIPPTNLHSDTVRDQPNGQLYSTIRNGVRNMAAYGPQIPVEDRWAIVAYVRALQLSQNADLTDVPEDKRDKLR